MERLFKACDGSIFHYESDCANYENKLKEKKEIAKCKFIENYDYHKSGWRCPVDAMWTVSSYNSVMKNICCSNHLSVYLSKEESNIVTYFKQET